MSQKCLIKTVSTYISTTRLTNCKGEISKDYMVPSPKKMGMHVQCALCTQYITSGLWRPFIHLNLIFLMLS